MEHLSIILDGIELDIEGRYFPAYAGSTYDEPIDAEFEISKVISKGGDVTELLSELYMLDGDLVFSKIEEICIDKF